MQRCPHCGRTLVGQREDHPELCALLAKLAPAPDPGIRELLADLDMPLRINGALQLGGLGGFVASA